MQDNGLLRKLNSVGKKAFVDHFNVFKRYAATQISREKAISELVQLGVSNASGAAIRLGNAKLIFKSSKQQDALDIIINSERLPQTVRDNATQLKLTNSL